MAEDAASGGESNGDNPLGIIIELSKDNQTPKNEESIDDLLGEEQFFPWEPGLGNHAGAVKGITGGLSGY